MKYLRRKYTNCVILTSVICFYLSPLKGFEGDGFSCSDINECATGDHKCDEDAECTNTIGSFTCECKQGKR